MASFPANRRGNVQVSSKSYFMKFASILLGGLLVLISPWMIGGNYLYFRTALMVVSALLGLMAALTCLVERKNFATSLLWLALPIAVAYALYQTLEISGPISTYPSASRAQLYVLGSAITLFLSSIVLFRDSKSIIPIFLCIGVVGAAVAFVGVVQKLGGNGKILWVYELLYGGKPFGPFVNRNNGAGFLVLTLAGPMFFLATQFLRAKRKRSSRDSFSRDTVLSTSRSRGGSRSQKRKNPFQFVFSLLANLETRHLYGLSALIAIVVGVFLSLSRGGAVSVTLGLAAGILTLMIANRWAVFLAGIVIAATIGGAIWTEQLDTVQQKLTSITEADETSAPRLLHWKDAMPYYQTHWLLGSGLGTYRYEYPVFQQQQFQGKFAHAENVYLETLAELGMPGVAALALTVLILFYVAIFLFRQPATEDRALGVAAITALVGLAAASCLDFGIYQPANFILAAILFGAVIGRASHPDCRKPVDSEKRSIGKYYRFGVLVVLVLASAYATFPSAAIESVSFARRQIALHTKSKGDNVRRLDKAESALHFAEKYLPEDWRTQYLLGQCEIFKHRQTLTEQVKQETEAMMMAEGTEAGFSKEEIEERFPQRADYWATTSMLNLHRVLRFDQARNPAEFSKARKDPELVSEELEKAWAYFNEALSRSDRSERIHYRLAQLTVMLGEEEGNLEIEAQHLDNALNMAKGYTGILYEGGLLCMHSGKYERAAELWSNCISRSRQYERRIVQFGLGLPAKLYFEHVLPQNPEDLLRLSRRYFSSDEQKVPNELLMVHTRRLIKRSELDDVKKWELYGQAWFQAKDYQKACDQFELVMATKPSRPTWRLDYANCLAEIGRYDDAIREMKICQLEQPESAIKISRLVEKIKRQRIRQRKQEQEQQK